MKRQSGYYSVESRMPLSKQRNRDRMREIRLHTKKRIEPVQPKPSDIEDMPPSVEYIDADGNPVYE